jgi:hypothetical protein
MSFKKLSGKIELAAGSPRGLVRVMVERLSLDSAAG